MEQKPEKRKSSYLAIDPGETVGYATFDDEGWLIEKGQTRWENFTADFSELLHSDLKGVICEKYVNYGWKQQKRWSDNKTSKMIGKIELLADLRGVPCHLVPAGNKEIGAMWGNFTIPPKSSGIDHEFVAAAHGIHWLQSNGIRTPGQFLKVSRDE